MKYLKKINEMDVNDYKSNLGRKKEKDSYDNRLTNYKKRKEESKDIFYKDLKNNLDFYMDLFSNCGVKEENFTDVIADDKLRRDFVNGEIKPLITMDDENKNDENSTIEIRIDENDKKLSIFIEPINHKWSNVNDTIENFNIDLNKLICDMFSILLNNDKANGCIKTERCVYDYIRANGKYKDYIKMNQEGRYEIILYSTDTKTYNIPAAKGITNKEFCDAINKLIKKYDNNLNNILNTIDDCKIYQDGTKCIIINADGILSYYETSDDEYMHLDYIDDDHHSYTYQKKNCEVEDEQEKIEIIKDLIKFGNDVKNEAIDE